MLVGKLPLGMVSSVCLALPTTWGLRTELQLMSVVIVAFIVVTVIMIFVVPAFKEVFTSFGADLPAPTLFVMGISEVFVKWWWLIFGVIGGGFYFFMQAWKRSEKMQMVMDRWLLKMPIFGDLCINKAAILRAGRARSPMFAAGVPLVEALDSVGECCSNSIQQGCNQQGLIKCWPQ